MGTFTLIFSIVVAVVCFWSSIKLILLYLKVNTWNKTNATIVSKKVELHKKNSTRNSPYGVFVDYKYNYDGKEYINNKVYLVELIKGQTNHTHANATKVINKMENEISIYFNPKDRQESVIFCTGIGLYILVFFFGIISLLVGYSYYE